MFINKFGERLKLIRKKYDLHQTQLAEILGVSTRAIQNYEAGSREPSFKILLFIATYFFVSLDYLFGITDDECYAQNMIRVENLIIVEMDAEIRSAYLESRPTGEFEQYLPLYIQSFISWNQVETGKGFSVLEFTTNPDGEISVKKVSE